MKSVFVRVKTQEEWDNVSKKLEYNWDRFNWVSYGTETCINIKNEEYSSISICNNCALDTISYAEFESIYMKESEKIKKRRLYMTPNDLIPGEHIVKTRYGEYGVVVKDLIILQYASIKISNLEENLGFKERCSNDIVEVFEYNNSDSFIFNGTHSELKSIWQIDD